MGKGRVETTHDSIRPDFLSTTTAHIAHGVALKYLVCTPAEAGLVAGVSARTVQNWQHPSRSLDGKLRFRRGAAVGPYCVDVLSFIAYWRTGEPQGETVAARRRQAQPVEA